MKTSLRSGYLRRLRPEIFGTLSGVAFGLLFLFAKSPLNFLSTIVIVTGPTCAKSESLVSSILANAELQRVFTPLSVSDDQGDEQVARVCELAYEQVIKDAPWFRLAGRDWVCAQLREAAVQYRDQAHAILPVWVHDAAIVDVTGRDSLLEEAGYYLLPGGEGVVLRSDSAAILEARKPPPLGAQSEWRGQAIGF